MLWMLAIACTPDPVPTVSTVHFVRGGVLVDGVFEALEWSPGQTVHGQVAPRVPECMPLHQVELGDVTRLVAAGGAAPDTALAFSPDGSRLAIGAYTGEIVLVEAWTGRELARRRLAETMVKHLLWSADGSVLYAAEQSPDAYVHALAADLSTTWKVRLADHVGTSAPPPGDDLYGVYTLPAAYGMVALGDDVLVAAAHGWNVEGGRANASRLLRIDPAGTIVGAFPAEGAADAIFWHPRVTADRIAVPVGRSASGPAPADLPVDGLLFLDHQLQRSGEVTFPPLAPWFPKVFIWEAVDARDDAVAVGLGDGRVVTVRGEGQEVWSLGSPQLVGDVPIFASIGHLAYGGDDLIVLTSSTNIPFGAASPELRPPKAHDNENAVWLRRNGEVRWTLRPEHSVHGFDVHGDSLVVGAGSRRSDDRRDLFGALVIDLAEPALQTVCSTEGPVFFRQDQTDDGLIAVAEYPFDGGRAGAYRVTVFR